MINSLIKFLIILICLIIKIQSWTWDDYPSLREATYWKCGVTRPAWVCDPDGILTDQERKEIVQLVEDFKDKTKRPNSTIPCIREGLRLVVALARVQIDSGDGSDITDLCTTKRKWTSTDTTKCESNVQGIVLNSDGFRHCYSLRWLMSLYKYDFEKLDNAGNFDLKSNNNYFDALKNYIEKLRMLYNHYFSIFDNPDVSKGDNIRLSEVHNALQDTKEKLSEVQQSLDQGNQTLTNSQAAIEENKLKLSEMKELLIQGQKLNEKNTVSQQFFNNLYGIISAFFFIIIGLVLLFLFYRIRQLKNDFKQRNAPKMELQLMTPIQPVEVIEKKKEEEVEEKSKTLSNL